MPKQFYRSTLFLSFILLILVACSSEEQALSTPSASENSSTTIIPPTLPTSLPDQQERLEEASNNKENSVDFVIDTTLLESHSIPFRFANGENWYKFTAHNGAYSVLLYGSDRPAGLMGFPALIFDNSVEFYGVIANNSNLLGSNEVTTFTDPQLANGEQTPEEYLESLESSLMDGAVNLLNVASINIISQENIQLNNHPGRDFTLEIKPNEGGNASYFAHLRIYVVGDTVYQLYAANVLDDTVYNNENTIRFLDSFTLN